MPWYIHLKNRCYGILKTLINELTIQVIHTPGRNLSATPLIKAVIVSKCEINKFNVGIVHHCVPSVPL